MSGETKAPADVAPTPPRPHVKIGPFKRWGVEITPITVSLPKLNARSLSLGIVIVLLLGVGLYVFALRPPQAAASAAMRIGRYDNALEALRDVPRGLNYWPPVAALRKKALLGAKSYETPPDWEAIGEELRGLGANRRRDADLMVLAAQYELQRGNYENARSLAHGALAEDRSYAEAWFLLGLLLDLSRDAAGAADHYRKAVAVAPDSPHYRSNLARALLEQGRLDEAIREYRGVSQFPLARVEAALAHWAKGELREAADAQRDGLRMLADAKLLDRFYNRREWVFILEQKGIRLASLEDKRCYAALEESASRRLASEAVAFPPLDCPNPPSEIRELLADDLCRFVDRSQPALSVAAGELRRILHVRFDCEGPAQQQ